MATSSYRHIVPVGDIERFPAREHDMHVERVVLHLEYEIRYDRNNPRARACAINEVRNAPVSLGIQHNQGGPMSILRTGKGSVETTGET